jgi:SAM-dependent methyltransferase
VTLTELYKYKKMLSKITRVVLTEGLYGLVVRVEVRMLLFFPKLHKLIRSRFPHRSVQFPSYRKMFLNRKGLEFGGPSCSFGSSGICPVYSSAGQVDNCTFAAYTSWEGNISEGYLYKYSETRSLGFQYIRDSDKLDLFPSDSYDFIISCHMLEHSANPIRMLKHWYRITRNNGFLLLILPHYEATFDRFRKVTTLDHLIQDYKNDTDESDRTHFQDIRENHDIDYDGFLNSVDKDLRRDELEDRINLNHLNRMLHHHVFDTQLAVEMVNAIGYQIVFVETVRPNNIVILALKKSSVDVDNAKFLCNSAIWRTTSIFKKDLKL